MKISIKDTDEKILYESTENTNIGFVDIEEDSFDITKVKLTYSNKLDFWRKFNNIVSIKIYRLKNK